jgi:hypothetical protein
MASIKSSLPSLSEILQMSESAIYERQRALVRLGALKQMPGRGPGSGVKLDSQNVGTLLVGCAAFMSLSDLDERVHRYLRAPSADKICRLTGSRTLRDAIQAILEGSFIDDHPRVEAIICFNLHAPGADILWAGQLKIPRLPGIRIISPFGRGLEPPGRGPGIDFRSYVTVKIIDGLRSLLNVIS